MADEVFGRDENRVPVVGGLTNDTDLFITALRLDPTSKRLLVDSVGDVTQYDVNDAAGATDTGTLVLAIRDDSLTTLTPVDGDYVGLRVSATGALHVTGGGGGTEYTEDVVTANPQIGRAVMIERDDQLAAVTPAEADWIGLRGTEKGALWVALADASGDPITSFGGGTQYTEADTDATIVGTAMMMEGAGDALVPAQGTAAAGLLVNLGTNNDVTLASTTITSLIPGVGATNLGKAEDAVHTSSDVGVMALGVRQDTPTALAADGDYTPILTSDEGALWTEHVPNEVDSGNSSTSTLNSGIAFTGTGVDILTYDIVTVTIDASHDSATDGMSFQFSTDNSNWDDVYPFTYTAADGARRFQFPVTAQYFRVVYTNGGTNQTHFRLQTILHHNNTLTTIHRLVDDTSNDRSAQIVKAAIIAQKGGGGAGAGDFVAVQSTAAGNLKMSVQEISDGLDVGAGNAGSETQRVILASDQNFVHLEDAAHSTGDAGVMALAVENEDLADLSTGDKDYTPIAVTKEGVVIVKQEGTIAVTESTPLTGFATSALQLADGHAVTIDNISTNEVYVRGSGTAGSADAAVLTIQGIASMTPVAVTESSPISGFATSAGQLAAGHDVTIDNIATNEVYVRGGGTAGSPTDGEVVVVQGIAGADAVTVGGTVALTNDSIIGAGDPTIDSYAHIAINLNAGADQVLVSSAASKQIWVYGVGFTLSVAGTVSFQDEDDTAVSGIMDFAANSGLNTPPSGNFAMPIWKLGTDKDLEVDVVTAAIDGWLSYAIVSV